MKTSYIICLISFLGLVSCQIYSVENPDGSYTIGHTSDSRGESANSLVALLTKAAGYTSTLHYETEEPRSPPQPAPSARVGGLLEPHLEILQLIEVFLKFKGELASRLHDLVNDNYDLIRSVYHIAISKIGSLHTFSLIGIKILRKILEFAVALMAQWQINLPGISLDLSLDKNVGLTRDDAMDFTNYNNYYK